MYKEIHYKKNGWVLRLHQWRNTAKRYQVPTTSPLSLIQSISDEQSRVKTRMWITCIIKKENIQAWSSTMVLKSMTASKAFAPNARCLISGLSWSVNWQAAREISIRGWQTDKKKILDPPFCWSSKTREQMGHTPKHRHYCFLCYPPEEYWTVTTVNIHCRSIFIQMILFYCVIYRDTHVFLNPKKTFKWLLEKIGTSVKVEGIYFKAILHQSSQCNLWLLGQSKTPEVWTLWWIGQCVFFSKSF